MSLLKIVQNTSIQCILNPLQYNSQHPPTNNQGPPFPIKISRIFPTNLKLQFTLKSKMKNKNIIITIRTITMRRMLNKTPANSRRSLISNTNNSHPDLKANSAARFKMAKNIVNNRLNSNLTKV